MMENKEPNGLSAHHTATELLPLKEVDEEKFCSTDENFSQEVEGDSAPEAPIEEFIPTPPDGGWGWVVVLASFMNHFILDGISYAFGAFMLDYAEYFQSSAAATSSLMSTLIGCYMLSAPIASAFINKFGCRPVGIAGSVLASFSFAVCTLSTSIEVMIFLFGICGGLGFGMMYMPAVISVSLYFEKRRPLAVGIGMCGTGVGTLFFGPTSHFLLEQLGWQGAHFVIAGIILHGAVFAALIRPLETKHDRKLRLAKHLKDAEQKEMNTTANGAGLLPKHEKTTPHKTEGIKMVTSHPNVHMASFGSKLNVGSVNVYRSLNALSGHQEGTTLTVEEAEDLKRPLSRKDIFYTGSVVNLPEFKGTSTVQEYLASTTSIPAMHLEPSSRTFRCSCLPRQMADALAEMLDLSLLKDRRFLLVLLLSTTIMLAYLIPFAFTNVRAEQMGVSSSRASLLISILGISTMVGRLLSNLILQIPKVRALVLHNVFLLIAGGCCIAIAFCKTFATMAVAAFGYGLFMGAHIALTPIILVDLIGLNRLTTGYGVVTLVRGIAILAGPPLAGILYDFYQTYDQALWYAGATIILSALAYFLLELPCMKKGER